MVNEYYQIIRQAIDCQALSGTVTVDVLSALDAAFESFTFEETINLATYDRDESGRDKKIAVFSTCEHYIRDLADEDTVCAAYEEEADRMVEGKEVEISVINVQTEYSDFDEDDEYLYCLTEGDTGRQIHIGNDSGITLQGMESKVKAFATEICTEPTTQPTKAPSKAPTKWPTRQPTKWPTPSPSTNPTAAPTKWPTQSPTDWPTRKPTKWPTPWPTPRPTTASPTEGESSDDSGCGCKCDNLGYEIRFDYETCGDISDNSKFSCNTDCGKSSVSCGNYLHCFTYSIVEKDPVVKKSDCYSGKSPHVPEYIVIPLRDDCEYDMDADYYYDRIWDITMNGDDDYYVYPDSGYTVHYQDDPDCQSGVYGIQIDIDNWCNDENSFQICTFGGDPDPVSVGTVEVGWAFEVKEGRYKDEYGYSCSNEVELVDICASNFYSAKAVSGPRDVHRGGKRPGAVPTDTGDHSKERGAGDTDIDLKDVVDTEPWNVKLHGLKYYEHELGRLIGAYSQWMFIAVLAALSLAVSFCCVARYSSTPIARREGVKYGRVRKGEETEDDTDSELVPIME